MPADIFRLIVTARKQRKTLEKINKYASILSVLTLTLFLVACGDSGNGTTGSSAAGANVSDKSSTASVTSSDEDSVVNEGNAADTDNTGDAAANYVTFEDLTRTQSHPKAPAVG